MKLEELTFGTGPCTFRWYNLGGYYSPQPSAPVDYILVYLNTSHHAQPHSIIAHSCMSESTCGQDEVNSVFCGLATQVGKIGPSFALGISCVGPA